MPIAKKETISTDIDNIDKIRDILFGNQVKEFETKFKQLQDQLSQDLDRLREDSTMRFESLESFVQTEFDSLNQRLDTEQKTRIAEFEESSDKLEKRIRLLDNRLLEQERQTNDKARELRQLLLEQANDFFAKMKQKQIEDRELLSKVRNELDDGKIDRSTLSTLFTELALQISGNDLSTELLKKSIK